MSSSDDETACKICEDFEPQAWRKSLCRNCFHSLDEHSEDLLAAGSDVTDKLGGDGRSSTFPRTKSKVNDLEKDTKKGKGNDVGKEHSKGGQTAASKQKSGGAGTPSKSTTVSTEGDSKSAVFSKSKSLASKFESKATETSTDKSSKSSDSKSPKNKSKSDVSDKNENAKVTNDSKDKKSSKLSDKDSKDSPSRSKSSPFGKDMLKSAKSTSSDKDKSVPKDDKLKEEKKKSSDVGQRSQHTGNVSGVSDKAGQCATRPGKQDASEGKSSDVRGKFQPAGAGKSNGSSSDSSRVGDKDKTSLYRDRGKDRGGGEKSAGGEGSRSSDANTASRESSRGKNSPSVPTASPLPSTSPAKTSASSPSHPPPTSTNTPPSLLSPSSKTNDKRPKDLGITSDRTQSVLGKFKELEKKSPSSPKDDVAKTSVKPKESADKVGTPTVVKNEENEKLRKALEEKEGKVRDLEKEVVRMEAEVKKAAIDAQRVSKEEISSRKSQKDDMDRVLKGLKSQLSDVEGQCDRLTTDNQSLTTKLQLQELEQQKQESERRPAESGGGNAEVQLEEDLEMAEKELEDVKDENRELQSQLMEMKNEMDEMYDNFRENEHDEFRELQKELDMTAKNCRILQFKLRKCERRNEQIEEDRVHYEEKLRQLQDQFESKDAKTHIRVLEEELRVAKEVSVRLHDELDIVEDKRGKALEENRHLTELLEHTDKRQFRLEMEIDKLRDMVSDLKLQLKEAKGSNNNNGSSPDRKVPSSYIYSRSIKD